jgi:hypothetical protein
MNENSTHRCLIPNCENPPSKRGICGTHYNAFLAEKNKQPKSKRAEFERLAVEKGLLKPAELGGRPRADNPFAAVTTELSREPAVDDAVEKLNAMGAEDAKNKRNTKK